MKPRARIAALILFAAFMAVVPGYLSPTWQSRLVVTGAYALLALGLNVVVGLAGLLDLGYAAFFAIGSYTAAIFLGAAPLHVGHLVFPFWVVLPIGMLICMTAGFLLGFPVLRLRGDYLAIVTLGFGEIVRIVAENLNSVTGGAEGVTSVPSPNIPNPFGHTYHFGATPLPYYYTTFGVIVIVMIAVRLLQESRIGRAWVAIREDEYAAEAMGVNTLRMKLLAFAIGGGVASFAGVLQAVYNNYVSPGSFQVDVSITVLAMVVLGGMGNIAGAMVGAAAIYLVPEVMRDPTVVGHVVANYAENYRTLVFGGLLVVMMIYRPQGLIPSRRRARELKHAASPDRAPAITAEMKQ
ncbi:MAG TPA: branched-chain amino acid ABC transporter permease [Actinomycetota bacterium]|nr:branched-chain amino acid ABC transporter permease [Actinomycetota bacterium]